jgi:hypothetical protein
MGSRSSNDGSARNPLKIEPRIGRSVASDTEKENSPKKRGSDFVVSVFYVVKFSFNQLFSANKAVPPEKAVAQFKVVLARHLSPAAMKIPVAQFERVFPSR